VLCAEKRMNQEEIDTLSGTSGGELDDRFEPTALASKVQSVKIEMA
jgi:hypothetical protein